MTPDEQIVEDVIGVQLAVLDEFMTDLHGDGYDWAVTKLQAVVDQLDSDRSPQEKVQNAAVLLLPVHQRFVELQHTEFAQAVLDVRRALTSAADRYLPDTQRIGTGEFQALVDDVKKP
jgi:hypothetical protein